jgi:arsenate reductase
VVQKRRVLFICTHNSARSQMAEGLLRHLGADRFEAFSAGTRATQVRPEAIAVMSELGIDIGGQESKSLHRFLPEQWDYVITVCDDANESCPRFPAAAVQLHWSFPDPSQATGDDEERLAVYRAVRDSVADRVRRFVAAA